MPVILHKRAPGGGGGGGVTDHGALTGLADDDHPQYHTDARGNALYVPLGTTYDHGGLLGLGDDDHTQYHNDTRGDARYRQLSVPISHSALTNLANDDHTQYFNATRHDAHDHTVALNSAALLDLGDVSNTAATERQILQSVGGVWTPRDIGRPERGISELLVRHSALNTNTYGIPGASIGATSVAAVTANMRYYHYFYVEEPITITHMGFEVTTLVAGATMMGIVRMGNTGSPANPGLVYQNGTLNTTTVGVKVVTGLSVQLSVGAYFGVLACAAAATLRRWTIGQQLLITGASQAPAWGTLAAAGVGALADPVADYTAIVAGTAGMLSHLFYRWTLT